MLVKKRKKENPKRALEQTVHHLPSADWNNRGCQPFSQQIRTRRTPPFCSPPPPPPPRPLSPTTCVEKNEAFYTRDSLISPLPSCPSTKFNHRLSPKHRRGTPFSLDLTKRKLIFIRDGNREDR